MYVAKFTPAALENVKALPRNVRNALKKAFEKKLLRDPISCSEALGEPLAGFRSFHYEEHRIVFKVYEDIRAITVVGVGEKNSRPSIYDKLERLSTTGQLAEKFLSTVRLISEPR